MAEGEEDLPRDAKIMKSLIKSMGVEEHEPRVVHQFLELWYRYAVDVLTDAHVYSEHAGKASIDCDDVKLAIQSKVNFSFSQPPPREVFLAFSLPPSKCLRVHMIEISIAMISLSKVGKGMPLFLKRLTCGHLGS
uniref:Transcription initiation factor TFIID subunit 9 n=1 Tax=Chenopodium quinoa TaxID=63459 RepID=A0A803MII3_CHEQI